MHKLRALSSDWRMCRCVPGLFSGVLHGQRARLKILLPAQCPDQGLLLVETNPGFALAPRLFYLQIWGRGVGGDRIAAG